MARGWEGEKVRLVPLEKERHLENALLWMNDPEITRWLKAGYRETGRIPGRYWKRGACRDLILFHLERDTPR